MAEASGGRTHPGRECPPPAGFEDRDDHRTACASVALRAKATDRQTAVDQSDFFSDPRESVDPWPTLLRASCPLLLGLSCNSQIRLNGLEAGKLLLSLLV